MADEIRTARLLLRRATVDDAPALHLLYSDPEVMAYSSRLPNDSLEQTREFLAKTIASCENGEGDDFVVLHEGVVIGKAGLWRTNEIGFQFARVVWGRGFARETVGAILDRAFARGVALVMADVDPRNARSLSLLAKLGFVKTGEAKNTFQIGDLWVDSVYLERTAPRSGA
jgi:ribosomal-protein-alanine N-acetyltransferase